MSYVSPFEVRCEHGTYVHTHMCTYIHKNNFLLSWNAFSVSSAKVEIKCEITSISVGIKMIS